MSIYAARSISQMSKSDLPSATRAEMICSILSILFRKIISPDSSSFLRSNSNAERAIQPNAIFPFNPNLKVRASAPCGIFPSIFIPNDILRSMNSLTRHPITPQEEKFSVPAAEAEKLDAKRLDWIDGQRSDFNHGIVLGMHFIKGKSGQQFHGTTLRTAIDAALAAKEKP